MNNFFQDLTLYLTEECNLNCSYCYVKKNFGLNLTLDDVKKAVDIFDEHRSRLTWPVITILGGEPLLRQQLLLQTIDYIQAKYEKKVSIIVFTNGTLLTQKITEDLIARDVRIFISLDGVKKANDCYRKYFHSPKISTFDTVIKNIKALPPEMRKKIGVNMVVGPKTVPFFMKSILYFQRLGLYSIDFSVSSYDVWSEDELKILKKELNKFVKFYISIFSLNSKKNIFKVDILDGLIVKNNIWNQMGSCFKIKFAADKNFYFCDAFFSLSVKDRLKHKVGDLKKGIKVDIVKMYSHEANTNIAKVKHESYKWHAKHKRVYCPFSVYFYTKFNNENLQKNLESFYRISDIYTAVFVYLSKILKNNKKFHDFYYKENKTMFLDRSVENI